MTFRLHDIATQERIDVQQMAERLYQAIVNDMPHLAKLPPLPLTSLTRILGIDITATSTEMADTLFHDRIEKPTIATIVSAVKACNPTVGVFVPNPTGDHEAVHEFVSANHHHDTATDIHTIRLQAYFMG